MPGAQWPRVACAPTVDSAGIEVKLHKEGLENFSSKPGCC